MRQEGVTVPPPVPVGRERVHGHGPSNDIFGHVLYLVTAHQFLHILSWATNAGQLIPFLSYLFPGNIDGTDNWLKEIYKFDYYPMLWHNLPLLVLIFVHHSIFARKWMQNKIINLTSRSVERTLYVIVTVLLSQYVMQTWRPMPHSVWSLTGPWATIAHGLCAFGFFWTALSCLTFAHNDLFGYREAFGGEPPKAVPQYKPLVYQYSRSPLWFGMILALWSAADMSLGRLIFTGAWTIYSLIAGVMQERDMVQKYGKEYEDYQRQVPFLIPGLKL